MTIRRANKSDASSIVAISIEVWIGTYLKHGVNCFFADYIFDEFKPSKFEKLIADPNEFVFVSENEQGIDGYIQVSASRNSPVSDCSETEISKLYIQPHHQGNGIGKRLLTTALQYCRSNAIESVWLTANEENVQANSFYLRHGFEQVGKSYFQIGDQRYLNNVYLRHLS